MKKYCLLLLIVCINCYSPNVSVVENKIKTSKNKKQGIDNKTSEQKKEISSDEFVYLFFNKSNFINRQFNQAAVQKPVEINSNDYKVIVDYQSDGGRKIRLRNIKTGKEYVIKEGDNSGEIILVERALLYYKFKIGNAIIKVKK